jgi:hypothetical protein
LWLIGIDIPKVVTVVGQVCIAAALRVGKELVLSSGRRGD